MFNIGDTIWVPRYCPRTAPLPCPVCFTKRKVTLILGDGTAIETPCEYCGKGYEGPRGYVDEWVATPDVECRIVTAIHEEITATGRKVEYHCATWCVDAVKAFATRDEAMNAAVALAAEQDTQEQARRAHKKERTNKSYAWHVGYHKREAKEHRRQAEYHEARVVECAAHAKDKATNPASAG